MASLTPNQKAGTHSVRSHLRLEIDAYDEAIRRWIPGYARMLEEAAKAVAAVSPKLVLDLGAGTGALSEAVLEYPEVAVVELIDVDSEMLDQARLRLSSINDGTEGRVRFSLRSFQDPFPPCDAICASLALHHIETMDEKRDLYARAFAALSAGGVLVNGDCNMPGDATPQAAQQQEELYQLWVDHQVGQGLSEAEARQNFANWEEEDTYMPLEIELDTLRSVGFDADRVWNEGPIGVVVARKPARG